VCVSQSKYIDTRQSLLARDDEVETLRVAMTTLEASLEQLRSERGDLQDQTEGLQGQVEALRDSQARLSLSESEARSGGEAARGRVRELEKELARSQAEHQLARGVSTSPDTTMCTCTLL
jgi:chromosome segregation ATPase